MCLFITCVKQSSTRKSEHEDFLEFLNEFSLTQMVHTPTRLLNTLDLFITNSPSIVKSVHVIPGYSDHETVVVDCALAQITRAKKRRNFLNFYEQTGMAFVRQSQTSVRNFFVNSLIVMLTPSGLSLMPR